MDVRTSRTDRASVDDQGDRRARVPRVHDAARNRVAGRARQDRRRRVLRMPKPRVASSAVDSRIARRLPVRRNDKPRRAPVRPVVSRIRVARRRSLLKFGARARPLPAREEGRGVRSSAERGDDLRERVPHAAFSRKTRSRQRGHDDRRQRDRSTDRARRRPRFLRGIMVRREQSKIPAQVNAPPRRGVYASFRALKVSNLSR